MFVKSKGGNEIGDQLSEFIDRSQFEVSIGGYDERVFDSALYLSCPLDVEYLECLILSEDSMTSM